MFLCHFLFWSFLRGQFLIAFLLQFCANKAVPLVFCVIAIHFLGDVKSYFFPKMVFNNRLTAHIQTRNFQSDSNDFSTLFCENVMLER